MNDFPENRAVKFHYHEKIPPREITHLALCFFAFSVKSNSSSPLPHVVFPDGCISLLYRRNGRLKQNHLLLKGLGFEPFYTQVQPDDIHWGVKFLPSAVAKILRCAPPEILTGPVFEDGILAHLTKGLPDKLEICTNFEAFVDVMAGVLKNLRIDGSEIDSKVTEAVRYISRNNGEKKIAEVAELVGLSLRQLERRFRKASGISPKQFSRVCRLRATALNLLDGRMNWANRAAEMGFTDQAHLIREFSSLTNLSPKSFEKRVRQINYDNLVK